MMHAKTAAAVDEVIRMIADGQLAGDGYLPSICQLAERLSIGRGVVPSRLTKSTPPDRRCNRFERRGPSNQLAVVFT